ncbi:MAG: PaaI family thioesterase [Alcanivoracaceae bacterium]|nr:PaaI family thioesterase [Alcanivoracaceae bacterium]
MTSDTTPKYTRLEICRRFVTSVRHSMELGIEVTEAEEYRVTAIMPWQARLVGNPDSGILHGGAVFAFLDQVGGLAVATRVYPSFEITPTIDFRLDHLRAPAKGKTVVGVGECYRLTEHVAFIRLTAYEEGQEHDPLATGLATYMRMKISAQNYFGKSKHE